MRLFVAIELDEAARQAIGRLQERLGHDLDRDRSLRWVKPAQMHLTLVFLGEVAEGAGSLIPRIIEAVSAPVGLDSFPASLQGLGVFPPRGAPRVLWLGVGEGREGIIAVQRDVSSRLAGLGVELEPRPFSPHLTLARWRPSAGSRRSRAPAVAHASQAPVARIDVDHVTLYQSRLSPAGSTYTPLARATLT